MSMVRLLTAGKCLVGLKDSTARYRMADAKSLPKFESTKNPFRATTRAPLAEAQQSLLLAPDPEPQAPTIQPKPTSAPVQLAAAAPAIAQKAAPISTPPLRKPQAQNGRGPGGATISAPAKVVLAPARPARGLVQRWTTAIAERFGKSRPARAASTAKRGTARPVQGELSLDKVKVCCNDLSDSDVEVVAVPLAPKRANARAAAGAMGVE